MKPIVVCDFDDVISDTITCVLDVLNNITGKSVQLSDVDDYNWTLAYDGSLSYKDIENAIIDHKIFENSAPIQSAVEACNIIAQSHELWIVSSRAFRPDAHSVTKEWIDQYNVPFDKIFITDHGEKGKLLDELNVNPVHMIDDHCSNLDHCEHRVENTFLVDRPWNAKSAHTRVSSLYEVAQLIK